jgi:uncharacterized protein
MELALQVVGLKMTGRIEDAREVAMRIVNTTGPDNLDGTTSDAASGAMQLAAALNFSADVRRVLLSGAGKGPELEKLVLDFLAILDTPLAVRTYSIASAISHANASGQTLLHLATFLGFTKVVDFLVTHEIDLDARDKNGFTALHFAALGKSVSCAKVLIEAGASVDIVNALGKTPAEIAPPGLLDDVLVEITDSSSQCSAISQDPEEEAAWADIEEADSEEERPVPSKGVRLRRPDRKLKAKSLGTLPVVTQDEKPPLNEPSSSEKTKEATAVDEKQLAASIMEMVQRTFAQLQHPQGMMQNLPLQFPGMPAWGVALPQMPAVFPVYVPMIPALWNQDRRGDSTNEADNSNRNQPWLGIPSAQEWKAVWDKWVQATRSNEEAPPAYTPREMGCGDVKLNTSGASTSQASTSYTTTAVKRVSFEPVDVPLSETEVKSFGYHPVKKQARKHHQVKHDRMLVLFWIPILLSECAFVCLLTY